MPNLTLFDPFGILTGDPFKQMQQMQSDMFRMFGQFLGTVSAPPAAKEWKPMIETLKKDDSLIIKCELPNVAPGDVDVSFDESTNQLVIKGERKQNKETGGTEQQQSGKFELLFTIPTGIKADLMKATFNSGVLEMTVPMAAAAPEEDPDPDGGSCT